MSTTTDQAEAGFRRKPHLRLALAWLLLLLAVSPVPGAIATPPPDVVAGWSSQWFVELASAPSSDGTNQATLTAEHNDIEATHLTESPVERRSVERARRSRDRPSIEGPLTDRPPKSGDPWRLDGLRLAAMRRRCVDCDADDMAVRCLIVDDSVQFLEVARSGLHRDGIDVVGTATTSLEALYEVQRLRPDVVLVDIGLGDESGFDLSRRLAELPEFRARIVLISTRAQEDLAELIAASPAVGFIPKSRLSAKAVRKLVDESPNAPQGK